MEKLTSVIQEHNLAVKFANLSLVLISWSWVVKTSSLYPAFSIEPESVLTFLATIFAFGWIEHLGSPQKAHADQTTARHLIQRLPSDGNTISFLKNYPMGGMFEIQHVNDLEAFSREWKIPEKKFHSIQLEDKRRELVELIENFVLVVAQNTWRVSSGWHRVPPEWHHEQPDRWKTVVDQLNHLANEIFRIHQDLVASSRTTLKI